MNIIKIVLLYTCCISSCWADIWLSTGNLRLSLVPARGYTVGDVYYKDKLYCNSINSNQGTVLRIDKVFSGSGHGHEVVLSTNLSIDGKNKYLQDGQTYSGNIIVFKRMTVIGLAYVLKSTITVSYDMIDEQIELQGIDPDRICDVSYVFLASRANKFDKYASFNDNSDLLQIGVTQADDMAYTYMTSATAVAQFDSDNRNGILSWVIGGSDKGLDLFIVDRDIDNKLYAWFHELDAVCSHDKYHKFRVLTYYFESNAQPWYLLPKDFVDKYCLSDVNNMERDCNVDIDTLSELVEYWLMEGEELPVDYFPDNIINIKDFGVISRLWMTR